MTREQKKSSAKIYTNEAVRGKPYLDIDRVIPESDLRNTESREQK